MLNIFDLKLNSRSRVWATIHVEQHEISINLAIVAAITSLTAVFNFDLVSRELRFVLKSPLFSYFYLIYAEIGEQFSSVEPKAELEQSYEQHAGTK